MFYRVVKAGTRKRQRKFLLLKYKETERTRKPRLREVIAG